MSTAVDTTYVKSLESAMQQKRAEIDGIAANFKDETGNGDFVIAPETHTMYLKAIADLEDIANRKKAEERKGSLYEWMDGKSTGSVAGADAANTARGTEVKTLGQQYLDSEVYKGIVDSNYKRLGDTFAVKSSLYDLQEAKDLYSASGGAISIPGFGSVQNLGLQPRKMRPGRVRDLFPTERTTAALLYGMREMGFVNNARVVAERTAANGSAATGQITDVYGLKPMSQIDVQPVTYPIATIAHLMTAHRNVLADEPRLRGLIDSDMIDGVKMAEDFEILYGDGTGENLTGVYNTPGVQSYTGLSSDKKSAQVRRAMTRAILAYYQPTGVVMHPLDWEDLELETDRNGAYTIATSVAIGGEKRVWRLNVVDTPAHQAGGFLLGAFGQGAKLFDREEVNVVSPPRTATTSVGTP